MKNNKFIFIGVVTIIMAIIGGFLSGFLIDFNKDEVLEKEKNNLTKVMFVTEKMKEKEQFNRTLIDYREVPKELVRGNIIISLEYFVNSNSNKNYCIKEGILVPKDSLFYTDYLVECDSIEEDIFEKVEENNYMYELEVDLKTSIIEAGDYIAITLSRKDDTNNYYRNEYIRGIPVLKAFNKSLIVEVNEEVYDYLEKAHYLEDITIEAAKIKNKTEKFIIKDSEMKDYVLEQYK